MRSLPGQLQTFRGRLAVIALAALAVRVVYVLTRRGEPVFGDALVYWIDAKHALLRQLEEKDRRIASLEAKLAREAAPEAPPQAEEPSLFS